MYYYWAHLIIDRGKMVVPVGYSSKICFENY